MARLMTKSYKLLDNPPEDAYKRADAEYDAVLKLLSQDLPPAGRILGTVLRFSVADGYAVYIVVKEKPLTLQYIPFGDCYTIPAAYIRGLTREDIVDMIEGERAWRKLVNTKER